MEYRTLIHERVAAANAGTLNELPAAGRAAFLADMALIGDALIAALGCSLVNYSILGNADRALHAHVHPRYADEPGEFRDRPPFFYHFAGKAGKKFDPDRDGALMLRIGAAIDAVRAGRG